MECRFASAGFTTLPSQPWPQPCLPPCLAPTNLSSPALPSALPALNPACPQPCLPSLAPLRCPALSCTTLPSVQACHPFCPSLPFLALPCPSLPIPAFPFPPLPFPAHPCPSLPLPALPCPSLYCLPCPHYPALTTLPSALPCSRFHLHHSDLLSQFLRDPKQFALDAGSRQAAGLPLHQKLLSRLATIKL